MRSVGFRVLHRLLRAGRSLEQGLGALVSLGGVGHRRFRHLDIGLLQVRIDGEQRRALLDRVALAHRQRFDPADLVGTDEDQIGLDPALVSGIVGFGAGGKRQQRDAEQRNASHIHVALLSPNSTPKYARIIARISSGSKRSNNPLQMIATMPGAGSSCGKRTSASELELTPLVGTAQDGADRFHRPRDHLAIVEFGELGEAWPFGQHQANDVLPPRLENLADENLDQLIGHLPERNVRVRGPLKRADHRAELQTDQLLEQRLLVGEVKVDRALGDIGALGHVFEPGRGKAARREFVQRRRQDGIAALGAPLGARAGSCCRGGRARRCGNALHKPGRRFRHRSCPGLSCRFRHGSTLLTDWSVII